MSFSFRCVKMISICEPYKLYRRSELDQPTNCELYENNKPHDEMDI